MGIVSALADGELTFAPPFDLATSAALARNIDTGRIAQALFDATQTRDTAYRVTIAAISPDDELAREIIDTTVASTRLLVALLDGLMEELHARRVAGQSMD